jgi:hypothetical protein
MDKQEKLAEANSQQEGYGAFSMIIHNWTHHSVHHESGKTPTKSFRDEYLTLCGNEMIFKKEYVFEFYG